MNRIVALTATVAAGALSIAVAAYQQPIAGASQGRGPQGPPVVTADKVKDNLYVLKGGGGNTAAFITANGVVVIDAKNAGWGQPILDKVKELTPKPVTMLINTHTHGDHVSGNVEFAATVDIIAQENAKAGMERMPIFVTSAGKGLPKRTFTDRMTIGSGADQIDLYYFGPGHTNGDAWVVFPALRTVHAGDLFASKGLPLVDPNNGGSVLHYAETLVKASRGIMNVDTVINGHSPTTTTAADLKTYSEFMADFVAWAQTQVKAGKTPEQAAAEYKVPDKYPGYSGAVPNLFGGLAGEIKLLSDEMKK